MTMSDEDIIDLKTEIVDWFQAESVEPRMVLQAMVEIAGEIIGIRARDKAGLEDGVDIACQTMEWAAERSHQMKGSIQAKSVRGKPN